MSKIIALFLFWGLSLLHLSITGYNVSATGTGTEIKNGLNVTKILEHASHLSNSNTISNTSMNPKQNAFVNQLLSENLKGSPTFNSSVEKSVQIFMTDVEKISVQQNSPEEIGGDVIEEDITIPVIVVVIQISRNINTDGTNCSSYQYQHQSSDGRGQMQQQGENTNQSQMQWQSQGNSEFRNGSENQNGLKFNTFKPFRNFTK